MPCTPRAWPSWGSTSLGVDVDEAKIESLSAGRGPVPRARARRAAGASTSRPAGCASPPPSPRPAAFGDVHFLCVGTPQATTGSPRRPAATSTPRSPRSRRTSTGATWSSASRPSRSAPRRGWPRCSRPRPAGADVDLAWNPEFLREGFAVEDTLRPDRLVVGVAPRRDEAQLREVYAPVDRDRHPVRGDRLRDRRAGQGRRELVPRHQDLVHQRRWPRSARSPAATSTELAEAIGHDERIGRKFLNAGVGFGGGCLPKDIRAFLARADELGVERRRSFLREVDAHQPAPPPPRRRARASTCSTAASPGPRIAVLGAAFKPDSDDIRDSPALDVAAGCAAAAARGSRSTTRRPTRTPARSSPSSTTPSRRRGRLHDADLRPAAHRVARVPRPRPRRARAPWSRAQRSSTAATCSTPPPGAPPAGPPGPSAAPDAE